MPTVDEIADAYVDAAAAVDPFEATYAGIAGHDHEITDLSLDGFAHRAALARDTIAALAAVPPASERERTAAAAMTERLGIAVELYDAGLSASQLNVVASPLQTLREVFDLMPTDGEQAWSAIADRLRGLPAALTAYRRTLTECAARGQVSARRQVAECAGQCRRWVADDLFGALARGHPDGVGSATLQADLDRAVPRVNAAVTEFAGFLTDCLAPRAPDRDAVGRERYALFSREFLGATVDLDETYAWGFAELARIEAELAATAEQIEPGATVDEVLAALDADPARILPSAEAFREWMQQLADTAVAELAGVHFDIPEPVRRIEAHLAPTSDGGIYYTGPSEDFTRPGRIWWSIPKDVTTFRPWHETSTVYHEGVPGHHLQIGQTLYRTGVLNRWQRLMCWISGHGEGWALYAERLMDELGYLADPADRLGMLDGQAMRAVRVVVDIGMHLELPIPAGTTFGDGARHDGERWTPDLGYEFLLAHCRSDPSVLRYEHARYLGWPGQAPSYKVGERIWRQARDDAKARHGTAFDLCRFHREALDLGPMGLDPLRAALARL